MGGWVRQCVVVIVGCVLAVTIPHGAQAASVPGVWHLQQDPYPRLSMNPGAFYLVGDSLTFGVWSAGNFHGRIGRQGWMLSGHEIHGGMELWELQPRLERVIDDVPQTVVIALGTNDLVAGGSVHSFRLAVRRVLHLLADRRVIWIGLHEPVGWNLADRTRAFNRVIKRELLKRPSAVFGNWSRLYDRNPGWLPPDDPTGVHLTEAGSRALTGLIIRQLRALPALPGSNRRDRVVTSAE